MSLAPSVYVRVEAMVLPPKDSVAIPPEPRILLIVAGAICVDVDVFVFPMEKSSELRDTNASSGREASLTLSGVYQFFVLVLYSQLANLLAAHIQ